MAADFPYEREVDEEAAAKHRERVKAMERRARIRTEMHRAAGTGPGGRRAPGSPPLTESVTVHFTVDERKRIDRVAALLGVHPKKLVHDGVLVLAAHAEGRL